MVPLYRVKIRSLSRSVNFGTNCSPSGMNRKSSRLTAPGLAALIRKIGTPGGSMFGRNGTPFRNSPMTLPNLTHSQDAGTISSGLSPPGINSTSCAFGDFLRTSTIRLIRDCADSTSEFSSRQSAVRRPEQAAARMDWRKRLSSVGSFSSRCWQASTWPNSFSSFATIRRCSASGGTTISSSNNASFGNED